MTALPLRDAVPLAPFTTLELGGPARHLVVATDEETLLRALAWADRGGLPVTILGGGSNVVVAPVLSGEPQTTSVQYSPPLLVLSLFLATVAGVLAVTGIARLRRP